jgi:signal transduction histidine kinase
LEGRQYKPTREQFDFTELVQQTVREYSTRYPDRFVTTIAPQCNITGDRMSIAMAISNLLENAVKYSPADREIAVTLQTKNGAAVLQVADEGPGIPDAEKRNVFNKFYRLGNEESRKTKGTGLGLYLTNKIALQHKGIIVVKDNHPQGSIFELQLPY